MKKIFHVPFSGLLLASAGGSFLSLLVVAVFFAGVLLATALDAPPPGAFTVVVIPDTQDYRGVRTKATPASTAPLTNAVFSNHIAWIRANVTNQNIVFVSHVGDIVDINNEEQWALARQLLDGLVDVVPFGLSVGNHDMKAAGETSLFQKYFPSEMFSGCTWYGGSYEPTGSDDVSCGNNANSFQLFSAGGIDFVFLHLACNAPDPVLAWAGDILTRYHNRVALLTTHMDLGIRTKPKTSEEFVSGEKGRMEWRKCFGARGNTPLQMWDKLYRKHANLSLIFSGDQSRVTALRLSQAGDHGTIVHALLSDYESSGPLRLYRFLPAQRAVQVITYDTTKHQLVERTQYVPDRAEHQFMLSDVLPDALHGKR